MKKALLLVIFSLLSVIGINAQSIKYATKWLITKPFERNVFIENKGQFPDYQLEDIQDKVLYYTVKGKLKVYYAPDGLIFEYDTIVKAPDGEKLNGYADDDNKEEDGKKNLKMDRHFAKIQWEGGNTNPQVEVQNPVNDYFTYANPNDKTGKSGIKAHAFGKLIYRNVYKGIDVVFYYPEEKGGLEYDVIVHPGADVSAFKMHYTGATALLNNGSINMATSYGVSFTDHSPEGTDANGNKVSTSFKLENNTASFEVAEYDKTKTLTIDPWLTVTAFTGVNKAFDLDYDVNGNVYIYGGGATSEYQIKKYNNAGTLQWTYIGTMPYIYSGSYFYGSMVADERTGTTYICEGFDPSPGSNIIKINANGLQLAKYAGGSGIDEMWHMAFDYCNNQILIATGGSVADAAYADTNMVKATGVKIFGAGTQDQTLISTDGGANCYIGSCKMVFASVLPNYLAQAVLPTLSPVNYKVYDRHGFVEITNINYYPPVGGYAGGNGFNGLAANSKIVVTYDGGTGRIWRASTGALIDSVLPSATHYTWGGLDLDCKSNIYCGNNNSISVYDSSANSLGTIPLSGTVYALRWDPRGLVYACGNGFVQAVTAYAKLASVAVVQPVGCSCTGSITANACGVGPFSYSWSNGATTSSLTGLCAGAYTVTINASGCFPRQDTAMATITGSPGYTATLTDTNPDCGFKKGNITVIASGGVTPYTYNWSNGSTNQKDTGLSAGTYTVTVTDNAGCKYTISATLINPTSPIVKISPSPDTLCQGSSVSLTASGAKTYTWNPG
ncbi:MAG TPA: SprB repeat-containing protein, partial [Bacteroidia bacterium]|nr:SprB repeat-containing protein [Bacteroidia bacterium]